MIPPETIVRIRRLFFAEHWRIGTIAGELGLHHDSVRRALDTAAFHAPRPAERRRLVDPYVEFIRATLDQHPRLRATRVFHMIRERGYGGSVFQVRRIVAELRPRTREAFLRLHSFPGEQAQVDWAHFGKVRIGRAERALSAFVLTLSWSRALYLEFGFDQTLESFLAGHVRAFEDLGGVPRLILTDNLRSAVIDRRGDAVLLNPRYLELCGHYHTAVRPCRPARGNEKGRVERSIQFIRHSFFAARPFTTLADFNAQAIRWRDEIAHGRLHPADKEKTVAQMFDEERSRLLPLPAHPFETELCRPVRTDKEIYVRFDANDYSIPPEAVGRELLLVADREVVRLLDGQQEIARHRRSFDRGAIVETPAHREALVASKRKAQGASPKGRLFQNVPEAEAFVEAALVRQVSSTATTRTLVRLLDEYGAPWLRLAVREALERNIPTVESVLFLLEKRRRSLRRRPPLSVDLTRRPELADLHVRPHNLETYDELTHDDDPEQ